MSEPLLHTVERVNSRFAVLLQEARASLQGGREFSVENVRQLRAVLAEMAPIVARSSELSRDRPQISAPLQVYKAQLRDLQATLVQIRIVLQTRQATLNASQSHNAAVSGWVSAFHLTR